MDDIIVTTKPITDQDLFSDLRECVSKAAKFFGVPVDDLVAWRRRFWLPVDLRDRAIAKEGSVAGIPFFQSAGLQSAGCNGWGIVYYENRLNPDIKYAVVCLQEEYGGNFYATIALRSQAFKLRRNFDRQLKQDSKTDNAPILAGNILQEMIDNTIGFLRNGRAIEKYGVKVKRGIILDGSPGNGKTMLCRHIQKLCTRHNISWGSVTAADIDDAYEHKGLNDLFTQYDVTFFDDIDISYLHRGKGNGKMACSMLTAMDGMSEKNMLVRIFTTNEQIDDMDEAFTRPGRIDKCITLEKPDINLREKLVRTVWPAEIQDNIDIEKLLQKTEGFSFAEVESIRTFLVTNRIVSKKEWNLDKAFEDFYSRTAEPKRKKKSAGFGFTAK